MSYAQMLADAYRAREDWEGAMVRLAAQYGADTPAAIARLRELTTTTPMGLRQALAHVVADPPRVRPEPGLHVTREQVERALRAGRTRA